MTTNTEFKVGDIVNAGSFKNFYTVYGDWAKHAGATRFVSGKDPIITDSMTIKFKGQHLSTRATLYLVESVEGQFITDNENGTMTMVTPFESDYDKGMREAMKKIAISCGKKFGVDVGYEGLPNLVESLVNPKPKQKEPEFKHVKVEKFSFDLKSEFEAGELFFKTPLGNYVTIIEEIDLAYQFNSGKIYRRVELTEEDELLDFLTEFEKEFIKLSDKCLKTALDKFRNAKID